MLIQYIGHIHGIWYIDPIMRDRYKITDKDGVYFVTSTIIQWLPVFTSSRYCDFLIDSLKFCMTNKSLKVYAYVILDNHIHLIVSCPQLSETIAALKKYTARNIIEQLKRDGKEWLLTELAFYKKRYKDDSYFQIWQEGVHPELVTSTEMFTQKAEYIHNNPVKRGLVESPECWRYSSARNYIHGDHSLIEIDCSLY